MAIALAMSSAALAAPERTNPTNMQLSMDEISHDLKLPNPCDNPATRQWGPDDELGNLNYLSPERVR